MAQFDPTVIADIGRNTPDIPAAMEKGVRLKDMIDQSQLDTLKINSAKSEARDAQTFKDIMKGSDYSTPEGLHATQEKLTKAGLVDQAMNLKTYAQKSVSGELDNQLKKAELAGQQQEAIVGAIDPIIQELDARKAAGDTPAMLDAKAQQLGQKAIADLTTARPDLAPTMAQFAKNPQSLTYAGLKTAEMQSKKGLEMIKAHLAEHSQETKDKAEAEHEKHDEAAERHMLSNEALANRRENDKNPGGGKDAGKVDAVYAAMADTGVSFPSGMRSVKAQRDTIQGLLAAHPDDSPAQIAERVRSGKLGLSGAQTELNTVARREGSSAAAINALNRDGGLYDQLLETGKKIDFGSAKFKNSFDLWKQGAVVADPDISEYINTLADTRAEFASVLARGGQVTDSVRIASEHAFPDKMSNEELQRNVERSKKIAESIQSGNTSVADAIIKGKSLDEALKDDKGGKQSAAAPKGTITSETLAAYATKHGMTSEAAKQHLADQGVTVQ
jgi:hypothetical protein